MITTNERTAKAVGPQIPKGGIGGKEKLFPTGKRVEDYITGRIEIRTKFSEFVDMLYRMELDPLAERWADGCLKISSTAMKQRFGADAWQKIRTAFLASEFGWTNRSWVAGNIGIKACQGYKINKALMAEGWTPYWIDSGASTSILPHSQRKPRPDMPPLVGVAHKHREQILTLTVDPSYKLDATLSPQSLALLESLDSGYTSYSVKHGRHYHVGTKLAKGRLNSITSIVENNARQYLRLDGEQLVLLDMSHEFWLLLTHIVLNTKLARAYQGSKDSLPTSLICGLLSPNDLATLSLQWLCQVGTFYDVVASQAGCCGRRGAKEGLAQVLALRPTGKQGNAYYFHKVRKWLEERFPAIHRLQDELKRSGYIIANVLSEMEGWLWFEQLLPAIWAQGFKAFGCHDAIYVKKSEAQRILAILDQELATLGCSAMIREIPC